MQYRCMHIYDTLAELTLGHMAVTKPAINCACAGLYHLLKTLIKPHRGQTFHPQTPTPHQVTGAVPEGAVWQETSPALADIYTYHMSGYEGIDGLTSGEQLPQLFLKLSLWGHAGISSLCSSTF